MAHEAVAVGARTLWLQLGSWHEEAARIAEQTGCRSLDALHLACATRAGPATTVLTFEVRQAQAVRSIGLQVIGT